ncbi:MAG: hypothetical protein JXQ75_05255, partial [Phycisphaerae bacterium]|nr:hypothetical protein [Phycisphaerae bacterium]
RPIQTPPRMQIPPKPRREPQRPPRPEQPAQAQTSRETAGFTRPHRTESQQSKDARDLLALPLDRDDLRRAIILAEILGPPVSERDPR